LAAIFLPAKMYFMLVVIYRIGLYFVLSEFLRGYLPTSTLTVEYLLSVSETEVKSKSYQRLVIIN